MLPVEESEAARDEVETKVAQKATEKAPEEKFKIAANEETQQRVEQMQEGEETEGSEEEDKMTRLKETQMNQFLKTSLFKKTKRRRLGTLPLPGICWI